MATSDNDCKKMLSIANPLDNIEQIMQNSKQKKKERKKIRKQKRKDKKKLQKSEHMIINSPYGNLSVSELKQINLPQRNVCTVWNLPINTEFDAKTLQTIFGKFGKIKNVVFFACNVKSQSKAAKITFNDQNEALMAINYCNDNKCVLNDGRKLTAEFGITHYCRKFLTPNMECDNIHCNGIHFWYEKNDIFVKENDNSEPKQKEKYMQNEVVKIVENDKAKLKFEYWLNYCVELPELFTLFHANQYDDITMVEFFDDSVLDEIGINEKDKREIILKRVNEFKDKKKEFEMKIEFKEYKNIFRKHSILTMKDLRNDIKSKEDIKRIFGVNDKQKAKKILGMIHSFNGPSLKQIKWRENQILTGKNTEGYKNFIIIHPNKTDKYRLKNDLPMTPKATDEIGKKRWMGKYRQWRQVLHEYDG